MTVDGEAGSGKTRLLTELAEEARADGATVLAGRCIEDGGVPRSRRSPRRCGPTSPPPRAALPAWVTGELARLLPELDPDAAPSEGEPRDARHRLFEAVAATIGHAARQAPVLLIVEDLHWADRATLGDARARDPDTGGRPLLVAGSLRDEGAGADPALHALLGDLRRERPLERVPLAGPVRGGDAAPWPLPGSARRRRRSSWPPSTGAPAATRSSSRSSSATSSRPTRAARTRRWWPPPAPTCPRGCAR